MRRGGTKRGLAVAIALVAPLGPARADDCPKAVTQLDLDECAGRAFKAADSELNLTYATIMGRLKADDVTRQALVGAQKAWLGFRDAECAFEASGVRGGSIQPMVLAQCAAEVTRARTVALGRFLHCQEGDTCPVPPR